MRGKHVESTVYRVMRGLIPAHAGKTTSTMKSGKTPPAHPRACGENGPPNPRLRYRGGSSPRMRGKLPSLANYVPRSRLIPAHAGKTRTRQVAPRPRRAHPRACGENPETNGPIKLFWGSSPRMRGKLGRGLRRRRLLRLIPAHAGKTSLLPTRRTNRRAHPRACGENAVADFLNIERMGSSPRMRGKLSRRAFNALGCRLIPAHAGKTTCRTSPPRLLTAHPRACGENETAKSKTARGVGSSPRMRGKPQAIASTMSSPRLIPAHAGKTAKSNSAAGTNRAHPRACGENLPHRFTSRERSGSSPRMRGKQPTTRKDENSAGLIPAHAGKTPNSQ